MRYFFLKSAVRVVLVLVSWYFLMRGRWAFRAFKTNRNLFYAAFVAVLGIAYSDPESLMF